MNTRHFIANSIAILLALTLASVIGLPGLALAGTGSFGYEDYAQALSTYVDGNGMVNYKGLKANRGQLDAFTGRLGLLDSQIYDRWSNKEKIALWVNAYNAFTLQAITDHYPIKASGLSALRFPDNSIRQISGVWDKLRFRVMGKERTLDEIEHEILRKEFHEPRIHMALVCAAMGCPPLRNEPYVGEMLDEQLDDQGRRFLANPLKFRVDQGKEKVHFSSIFKWFGGDFIETYGTDTKFNGYNEKERAILNFVTRYLDPATQDYLNRHKLDVEYLDYDWSLNEQKDGA